MWSQNEYAFLFDNYSDMKLILKEMQFHALKNASIKTPDVTEHPFNQLH